MTTNPFDTNPVSWQPCAPDQFAPFRRGDKALCLVDFPRSDWCDTPPHKGRVYTVRDYHWGNTQSRDGSPLYGQVLNLEGVTCDRVPWVPGAEWGWHHASFRRLTEEEAAEVARASVSVGQEETP